MFEPTLKLALERKSVRTYDGTPLTEEEKRDLLAFSEAAENPWGIPLTWRYLDGAEHGLTCPVIAGTDLFIAAKLPRIPHAEEAFGYSFERMVLYAWSKGIGTVWLGGTMNRPAFEAAMDLGENEFMPCASALGHPAKKRRLKEIAQRAGIRADSRFNFETVFLDGDWETPLTPGAAGEIMPALESVRWAPSAANRQPWRVLRLGDGFYFYKMKPAKVVTIPGAGDLQKVDLGIAMCHFAGTLAAAGISAEFTTELPDIEPPVAAEYIAGYIVK